MRDLDRLSRALCPCPSEDVVTGAGTVITQPRYDLCLGNWAQISAAVANVPTTQSGPPSNTVVMALAVMPQTTGIFLVSTRLSWSCNTTAITVKHQLITKQGSGAGVVSGGAAAAKFGQFSPAQVFVSSTGNNFTPNGMILNANAAGAAGLLFEGVNITGAGIVQHQDDVGTLTGLLTANGTGTQNFEYFGEVDAAGPGVTKTAFNIRQPVVFAIAVTGSGASSVAYDSVQLFVQETVTP